MSDEIAGARRPPLGRVRHRLGARTTTAERHRSRRCANCYVVDDALRSRLNPSHDVDRNDGHGPSHEPHSADHLAGRLRHWHRLHLRRPDHQPDRRRRRRGRWPRSSAFLWIRDATKACRRAEAAEPEAAPPAPLPPAETGRPEPGEARSSATRASKFLEATTLGLGAPDRRHRHGAGARLHDPAPFVKQGHHEDRRRRDRGLPREQVRDRDVHAQAGGRARSPGGRRTSATTASSSGVPSFTILSNRCVHLGCPVQVNGLPLDDERRPRRRTGKRHADPDRRGRRLRLPVPRRAVRHRGQPHRRPARPCARPLRVRDLNGACSSARRSRSRRSTVRAPRRRSTPIRSPAPASTSTAPRPALPGAAAPLMAKKAKPGRLHQLLTILLYPLTWLEERSGLVGGDQVLPLPQGPERHQLGPHARLGGAHRVHRPGGHRRDPCDVLQAGSELGVRVDPAHHGRPLAPAGSSGHAPLGRQRLHHPALPAHGPRVPVRRLQVPARAELDRRRR